MNLSIRLFHLFLLETQQTNNHKLALLAFAMALPGLFGKILPSFFYYTSFTQTTLEPFWRRWRTLEAGLIALIPVVIVAYVVLSLLPSLYAQTSAFRSNGSWLLEANWRFYILLGFCSLRFGAALMQNKKPVLLDGLNLAALLYSFALLASMGYPFSLRQLLDIASATGDGDGLWLHLVPMDPSTFIKPLAIGRGQPARCDCNNVLDHLCTQ